MSHQHPAALSTLGYLTVDEAAVLLGVTSKTMWRYLKDGKVRKWPYLGRTVVSKPEIDRLKKRRTAR